MRRDTFLTILSILVLLLAVTTQVRSTGIATGSYFLDTPLPIASYYVGQYSNSTYFAVNGSNWDNFLRSTNASLVFNTCLSAMSSTGGLLKVGEGTFTLTNTFIVNIDNITISGEGYGTLLRVADSTQINALRVIGCIGVTVKNLRINGNKAGNIDSGDNSIQHGLDINTCNYSTIYNVRVEECEHTGINGYDNLGLIVTKCHSINNGEADVDSGSGIDFDTCDESTISDCIVKGNYVKGIWISNTVQATVKGIIAEGNTREGIYLSGGSDNVVSACTTTNNDQYAGIMVYNTSNVAVTSCSVHDENEEGIIFNTVTYSLISDCVIASNNQSGVVIQDSNYTQVLNNNIHDNDVNNNALNDGVTVAGVCNYTMIHGNTILNNDNYEVNIEPWGTVSYTLLWDNVVDCIGVDHTGTVADNGVSTQADNNYGYP